MRVKSGFGGVLAQAGILLAAAAAVLLGGGMPQGSLGLFLGVASVLMIFVGPTARQSAWVWGISCFIVAASALPLLPSGIFEIQPWRQVLVNQGSFGPMDVVSVVPEESLFWLAILASTLVIGVYLLSQPVGPTAMLTLASVATLFCAAYAGLAGYAELHKWEAPFDAGPSFGFFPNRNHVATLLVMGVLTGVGVLTTGVSRRNPWALLAGGVGVGVSAWTVLLVSPSRAGIFLLAAGLGIWLFGLGRRRLTWPVITTALMLSVAALTFFLGIDNPASRRMVQEWGKSPVEAITSDYRFQVYQDVGAIWSDFPMTGSGMGSYRFLYPFYADASLSDFTTLHPESDWLFWLVEAGPLALGGGILLLVLVSRGIFSFRSSEGWGIRWALMTAALVAAIHGVFDVPVHRIELGWWVMVLLCLGLGRPAKTEKVCQGFHWQRVTFAVLGIFTGILAWQLIAAEWFQGRPLPPFAAKEATKEILMNYKAGNVEGALTMAIEESRRSPMSQSLHYQRGVLALHFAGMEGDVDDAFGAAKMLSPNWPHLLRKMGDSWREIDKSKAGDLWLEAVERQAKIDLLIDEHRIPGGKLYDEILAHAGKEPETIHHLKPPESFHPALHFSWIRRAVDPGMHLRELAEAPGFLDRLTDPERTEFLGLWNQRGEKALLRDFLERHPEWEEAAWAVRLQNLVAGKRHQEATELLASRFEVSMEVPQASGPFANAVEKDYATLVAARNEVAARRILKEALRASGQRLSAAHRIAAAEAAKAGDWEAAYKELVAHLKVSGQKLPSNL